MQLLLEKIAPYFLAFAATFMWWKLGITIPEKGATLESSLSLGAIITGFLATSKAILMTLDSPIMQRIRKTSYIRDLTSYLAQAIWLSFSYCIICVIGFFVDKTSSGYGLLWIFAGVASAGAFVRVTNLMLKIIRHTPS